MLDLGTRLELFVDHYLIESLSGARLKLHHPRDAGVAVRFDAPWEGLFPGCLTVIHDTRLGLYRMYYRGLPEAKDEATSGESTCLAQSVDGVHWAKPELGLYEINGSRRNNIVLKYEPAVSTNFSPFLDNRPGVPDEQRYKGIGGTYNTGIRAYASADGLRWRRMQDEPILPPREWAYDSQNVAFWSQAEDCYVIYFRTRKDRGGGLDLNGRWVSRATSEDFLHWSPSVEMEAGDAPDEEIYTQGTHPYFRAPHLYVALGARFWPGKRALTDEQARLRGVAEGYWDDVSDGVLMTSRGGNRYDRTFLESFLRPGPGPEHWVSRTNYPALGVVPTGPGEMSIYAMRAYASPHAHAGRFTLRTDGFASVSAGYGGGEMLTKPFTFDGSRLVLNYATSAAGSLRVEVQERSGRPFPGLALEDCRPIVGDEIEGGVSWAGGPDVAALNGNPVRLRFWLRDADLYSMRFK